MQNIKDLKNIIENKISESNNIFITFHNCADIDAIASALGLSYIIKKLGKEPFIILNENYSDIENGVKKIVDNETKNYNLISLNEYNELKSGNDLLIVLDANKEKQVCCKDSIKDFKDIIIIDHHKEDKGTINTKYKYIKEVSSTSEIIIELLRLFKVKIKEDLANYLIAGIYLDTNKYSFNYSYRTLELVAELLKNGADTKKINKLFEVDFLSDRKIQELISKATFITENIALCIADENVRYTKAELAKAANYLLCYKIDAVFAAGFIDNEIISISARSKGEVDVSDIMKKLGGGGHIYSAAAELKNINYDEISKKLELAIKLIYNNEETK